MSATETEVQATALGWRPESEFKGDPKDFVDAETFVRRGKEIMPVLRENNRKLESQLTKANRELEALRTAQEDNRKAIQELKEFNTEMSRQAAEQARAELLAQLKLAKKEGDTDREVELSDQIAEASAALREAKKAPKADEPAAGTGAPKATDDATKAANLEFKAWQDENPWYGEDAIKTGLANGIAQKMRKDNSPLVGVEFYKEVAKQTLALLDRDRPNPNKAEGGGRGSGGGSGGGGSSKGYADLPAEVKAACEGAMNSYITIGKGKTYETAEAFRTYYADAYYKRSE